LLGVTELAPNVVCAFIMDRTNTETRTTLMMEPHPWGYCRDGYSICRY
jgi:hypothetical protein